MKSIFRASNLKKTSNSFLVTFVTTVFLALFLMPFLYMLFTAVKTPNQMTAQGAPIWPAANPTYLYKGPNTGTYTIKVSKSGFMVDQVINMGDYIGKPLDVYTVPLPDGSHKNLALVAGYTQSSIFMDPANPSAP